MTLRRKKIQKVLEMREQTLSEKAGILAHAHEGCQVAQSEVREAASHLAEATEYRNSLTSNSIDVTSWIDAEQWLAHKTDQHAHAEMNLQSAEIFLSQAREKVIEARSNVKRMELLDKRLATGESRQQLRQEQKSNDEHARRHNPNSRRGFDAPEVESTSHDVAAPVGRS